MIGMFRPITLLSACLPLSSCGTSIGNPGKTNPESGFVATVDYDIPDTVSGLELASRNGDIFRDSSKRIDGTLDQVNRMLKQLNTDLVAGVGDFTGKGLDKKVSGTIAAISPQSAEGYDYSAVICYDKKVFQFVQWSSVTGNVHAVRDHSIDPVQPNRVTDMKSDIIYVAGDTASIKVLLDATPPKAVPGADGPKIADLTYSTRTAGLYTISGVHNWHTVDTDVAAEGDEYFLGNFNEEGVGEYLVFNRFQPECADSFDEAAPEWCGAGALLPARDYTPAEKNEATTRLSAIALQKKSDLSVPVFPANLTCPAE